MPRELIDCFKFAMSQLPTLNESFIPLANKTEDEEVDANKASIEWPKDVSEEADHKD